MNVLALNAGSNTLRYKLVATASANSPEAVLVEEMIDHVKGDTVVDAARKALADCETHRPDAIAVRVVHGGRRCVQPHRVTADLLDELEKLNPLAPLHQPTDLAVLRVVKHAAAGVTTVAVFDTAFHHTLPEVEWRYAIPNDLGTELRRFGFHGIAHRYVSDEFLKHAKRPAQRTRIISLHLGGGTSACAIQNGTSIATSMGLTPLEGTVMSTRCGDIDPGLLLYLLREGRSVAELEDLLYRKSGLLGLSGKSDDIRDILPAAAAGDARCQVAMEIFANRVRRYVGAYAVALKGLDVLILSGALAENSASMRAQILEGLDFLGVRLNHQRNASAGPHAPADIGSHDAPVALWLIPADEERQIARETAEFLNPSDFKA